MMEHGSRYKTPVDSESFECALQPFAPGAIAVAVAQKGAVSNLSRAHNITSGNNYLV
jgi:hypothetical protein